MRRSLARRFLFMGIPVFLLPTIVCSTTIIPFANLGEMTHAAPAIVLARVISTEVHTRDGLSREVRIMEVLESIKGPLRPGEAWTLPSLTVRGPHWVRAIPDEVELEEGETYLCFLAPHQDGWRPILGAYGVFQEIGQGEGAVLVPLPQGWQVHVMPRPDGRKVEPLGVFHSQGLATQLREVMEGGAWERFHALVSEEPSSFWPYLTLRALPNHCSLLGANGFGFRWTDFPNSPVTIHYPSAGDADCAPPSLLAGYMSDAVTALNANYGGITLNGPNGYSGFSPNCLQDSSAYGVSFLSWMNTNLGGYRHIVIQANDPCNQITNMTNCAGTLAVGGLYGNTPLYIYVADTFYQGLAGFVILNDSLCKCLSGANYTIVLEHEMTHALGLGHIESNFGTANMNPLCCNSISTLDIACVDYLYQPAPLPVEWLFLRAEEQGASVALHWATASEQGSAWYDVERSSDGARFSFLGRVPAAGHSLSERHYAFTDGQPLPGQSYYRLRQEDQDGAVQYSPVVSMDRRSDRLRLAARGMPGDAGRQVYLFSPAEQPALMEYFDADGRLMGQRRMALHRGAQWLEWPFVGDPSGIGYLRVITPDEVACIPIPRY
jgi:hypothetical protein